MHVKKITRSDAVSFATISAYMCLATASAFINDQIVISDGYDVSPTSIPALLCYSHHFDASIDAGAAYRENAA
jgi:hypothetical protein